MVKKQLFKRSLCGGLTVAMLLAGVTCELPGGFLIASENVYAATYSVDNSTYTYEVLSDGTVKITGYSGAAESITIPSTIDGKKVTLIDDYAFSGIAELKSVAISGNVKSIGYAAFSDCMYLGTVTIPTSVTEIGDYAFSGCTSLLKVSIPSGVKSIKDYTFYQCSSMTCVELPTSLESIGYSAFEDTGLTALSIPSAVINIGARAFYSCDGLVNVTVPENVKSIGYSAFEDCNNLSNLTLSKGLTKIEDSLFKDCGSLVSVTIPENVSEIAETAFTGCNILEYINVNSGNTSFKSVNGVLFDYSGKTLIKYATGKKETSYTVPNGVTAIESNAFSRNIYLTDINISDSVNSIGNSSFSECSKLTNIAIPKNVSSIGKYVFDFCNLLTDINVDAENKNFKSVDGVLFDGTGKKILKYPEGKTATTYQIPNGVSTVGNSAFNTSYSLTDIKIPDSVTTIEEYAFYYCSGLENVTLPDDIISLEKFVFANCTGLTKITLPKNLMYIGDYAFDSCNNITEVEVPDGTLGIGSFVFEGCTKLEKLVIPASVMSIGGFSAWDLPALKIYGESGSYAETFAKEYEITFVEQAMKELTITLTSNKSAVNVGDSIVFTANADGGKKGYTYSFLINNTDTKAWTRVKAFSSSNTYTWKAGSAGNRKFYVEVKDSTGKVVRSSALSVVTKASEKPLAITATNSNSKPVSGTNVTITGKATGGTGSYTYSFLLYNAETKEWYRFGSGKFSSSNTHTWKTSGTGVRKFYVEVKDSSGKVVRSAATSFTVIKSDTALAITGNTSNATPSVGTTVTITGKATGGTAPYTYSFLINNPGTKEWYRYGNGTFKTSNTHTWKVSGTGTRNFYIEVKDGSGKVVRSKAVKVTIA